VGQILLRHQALWWHWWEGRPQLFRRRQKKVRIGRIAQRKHVGFISVINSLKRIQTPLLPIPLIYLPYKKEGTTAFTTSH
jgi:hypothetical protein